MKKKLEHNDKAFTKKINETKYAEIINSKQFKRLKKVSFLGAVDPWLELFSENCSLASDRYHHSIGVFSIALEILERDRDFPKEEIDLFLITSLLHDLGHGPLSHSVEDVFNQKYGINHHKKTNELICSESGEIRNLIRSFRLHETDVTSCLNKQTKPYFNRYFNGQFNVDTLDGIYRCYSLLNIEPEYSLNSTMTALLFQYEREKTEQILDGFWRMKSNIYNLVLYNGYGRIADEIATTLIQKNIESIDESDFDKTDALFYKKFPNLKEDIVSGVEKARSGLYTHHMHKTRPRDFKIRYKCRLNNPEAINYRYFQEKGSWVTLYNSEDENEVCSEKVEQYRLFAHE